TGPTVPVDTDTGTNTVLEGAASGTGVHLTAHSTDPDGVIYSITSDSSGGGFAINSSTGVVTVGDASKIDYESAAGHSYSITVQAADPAGNTSSQTFNIAVTDAAPSVPADSNAAANSVAEGAANGTTVGLTVHSTDVNGGTITYSLTDDAGGRFAINAS